MNYPTSNQYIYLTNAGAQFLTSSSQDDPDRKSIQILIKSRNTPILAEFLLALRSLDSVSCFQQLMSLIDKGYVCTKDYSTKLTDQSFELSLPELLGALSDSNHCAIADQEGFLLAFNGFELNKAEQAAILATEVLTLQEKRQHNIQTYNDTENSSFSMIDNNGKSQLNFWPLYFNQQIFILAMKGNPLLLKEEFTQLTWILGQRYL